MEWDEPEEAVQGGCLQAVCGTAEATLPSWKIQVKCKLSSARDRGSGRDRRDRRVSVAFEWDALIKSLVQL